MQMSQEVPGHSNTTRLLVEVPSEGTKPQLHKKMGFPRCQLVDGTVAGGGGVVLLFEVGLCRGIADLEPALTCIIPSCNLL